MAVTASDDREFTEEPGNRFFKAAGEFCKNQPLGVAGAVIVVFMILAAIFADFISVYDPEEISFEAMLAAPSLEHPLGTDNYGRDILTRIIYGARTALVVGFVSAFVGSFIGLVLGVGSAYFGGKIDLVFQRIMDVFLAFPLIILALAVVAVLGTGTENVIVAITIPFIPQCARVVRSNALALREIPYVDAARACGYSHARIIMRHMVPNVMAPFLIMVTAFVEPVPAWGLMLQGATDYVEHEPWVAVFPGLAITLAVFAFNLFGDALRDVLDPRLRSR
jgi:peptide/nickel transport system permease protein